MRYDSDPGSCSRVRFMAIFYSDSNSGSRLLRIWIQALEDPDPPWILDQDKSRLRSTTIVRSWTNSISIISKKVSSDWSWFYIRGGSRSTDGSGFKLDPDPCNSSTSSFRCDSDPAKKWNHDTSSLRKGLEELRVLSQPHGLRRDNMQPFLTLSES